MGSLKVFRIGMSCIIGEDIEGVISSICINYNNEVTYKVVWWSGRERRTEWLCDSEIKTKETKTKIIGFCNGHSRIF